MSARHDQLGALLEERHGILPDAAYLAGIRERVTEDADLDALAREVAPTVHAKWRKESPGSGFFQAIREEVRAKAPVSTTAEAVRRTATTTNPLAHRMGLAREG